MVKYISLGMDCCLAYQFEKLNLKVFETMPFDWCLSKNILDIIHIFETDWIHFVNKDNWIIESINNDNFNLKDNIISRYRAKHKNYKLIYPHDLLENNINYFIDKYTRRINRLNNLLLDNIIFIRIGTNKDIKNIKKLENVLKSKFINSKLQFINISEFKTTDWKRDNIEWKKLIETLNI